MRVGSVAIGLLGFAALFAAAGCGAQVPPVLHQATVSWTVPAPNGTWAGCVTGQPSCGFIISRLGVTSTAASCPASTGSNYMPLNQSSPATGTTYVDQTPGTWCYVAQTQQGAAISNASSPTLAPVTVLGNPTSPTMGTPAVADSRVKPALPDTPYLAKASMGVPAVAVASR